MLKESILLSYSTKNFEILTQHMIESAINIGIPLDNINIYYDDNNYNIDDASFGGSGWYKCLLYKIKYIIDSINKYQNNSNIKYIIISDCDVWFIKKNEKYWQYLENYLLSHNKSIFFMPEGLQRDVANGGFYILKNNHNTDIILNFFNIIYNDFYTAIESNKPSKFGDQDLINKYKKSIPYLYIPNSYMIWGKTVHNKRQSLIHHAVCTENIEEKLQQIDYIKKRYELY